MNKIINLSKIVWGCPWIEKFGRYDMNEREKLIKTIKNVITGNGKSETGDWNSPLIYKKSDCDMVCIILSDFIIEDRKRIVAPLKQVPYEDLNLREKQVIKNAWVEEK